jgi:hypothetical protein
VAVAAERGQIAWLLFEDVLVRPMMCLERPVRVAKCAPVAEASFGGVGACPPLVAVEVVAVDLRVWRRLCNRRFFTYPRSNELVSGVIEGCVLVEDQEVLLVLERRID